jgi:hypothetical protein
MLTNLQNVLLIGSGVSSTDIAKEIGPLACKVYQSSRNGVYALPASMLPPSAERVADIASFAPPTTPEDWPGTVTLVDGRVLTGIDRVILCTGYHITFPFLPSLHNDALKPKQADESTLVTDGSQAHNLHKDIFYIPDPTLAFVGIPFFTCTFTFFELQAIVVSKVFSGQAWLPSEAEMRKEYNEKVQQKGYGKAFHTLLGAEVPHVAGLVEWVNSQAPMTGGEKMEGHTEAFLNAYPSLLARLKDFVATIEAKIQAENEKAMSRDVENPISERRGAENPATAKPGLGRESEVLANSSSVQV